MQQNDGADHVTISIWEKLVRLSPAPSECCIFKVHKQLRDVNEKAYEPDIIAIGPYHSSKPNLKMMEQHKLRYLQFRLQQKNENVEKYVIAMRSLEAKARACYAESLNLNSDELVEMMVLDGFFIIELFRKFGMIFLREKNDPIFRNDWIVNSLQRDLMLFENQLPFFVLCELFDMIEVPNQHERLVYLALRFFRDLLPGPGYREYSDGDQRDKIKHLLGLVHNNWLPHPDEGVIEKKEKWHYIHCVTELREAGIQFKKIDKGSLFDINFCKGVMEIPPLTIEDRTESMLRNLIAYEQYGEDTTFNFVTDYAKFIDCLIDSPKDVERLSRYGIIDNWLGNDEVVSAMWNKITDAVTVPNKDFRYGEIFEKVNVHYNKKENRWMEKLWRNYLNGPWAIISVLAAIVLLVLTCLQTVFTIIK